MALETELGVDLSDVDLKAAEQSVAGGGLVAEGLHHAVLDGVRSGQANTGTPFREFTFRILAGPNAGQTVEHTLYLPHAGQDETKQKRSKNQLAIYLHRLGVKKKVAGADGKEVLASVEGKHDFSDVLGATCVIDVRHEVETWKDKKTGADRSMTKAKLTFEGVLSLDDPRCAKVPKASGAAVAQAAANKPAAKPKDTFADL